MLLSGEPGVGKTLTAESGNHEHLGYFTSQMLN
jgi:DNA polymerase III delta prime subunit